MQLTPYLTFNGDCEEQQQGRASGLGHTAAPSA